MFFKLDLERSNPKKSATYHEKIAGKIITYGGKMMMEDLMNGARGNGEFPDGSQSTIYMKFQKELPSAQGMSIRNDRAFILYDTGCCCVYDLKSRNPGPLASFQLGSYNPGIPTMD